MKKLIRLKYAVSKPYLLGILIVCGVLMSNCSKTEQDQPSLSTSRIKRMDNYRDGDLSRTTEYAYTDGKLVRKYVYGHLHDGGIDSIKYVYTYEADTVFWTVLLRDENTWKQQYEVTDCYRAGHIESRTTVSYDMTEAYVVQKLLFLYDDLDQLMKINEYEPEAGALLLKSISEYTYQEGMRTNYSVLMRKNAQGLFTEFMRLESSYDGKNKMRETFWQLRYESIELVGEALFSYKDDLLDVMDYSMYNPDDEIFVPRSSTSHVYDAYGNMVEKTSRNQSGDAISTNIYHYEAGVSNLFTIDHPPILNNEYLLPG